MAEELEGQSIERGDAGEFAEGGTLDPARARLLGRLSQEARRDGGRRGQELGDLLVLARAGDEEAKARAHDELLRHAGRAIASGKARAGEFELLSGILREAFQKVGKPGKGEACATCGHVQGSETRYIGLYAPSPEGLPEGAIWFSKENREAIDELMEGIRNRAEAPDLEEQD